MDEQSIDRNKMEPDCNNHSLEGEIKRLSIQLRQSEMKRKKQKLMHEKIMENLSTKLLDFEANLMKEQKEIQCVLKEKDQQIKVRENLAKALQTKLDARYCKQCGYPNAKNKMDVDWEISISKPESEDVKTLPPLSLPVPNLPPNISFMSNRHFRQPKSKLSPVAEESEVTFASNLRNVHADLNPERFHAALAASLQSVVENKILPCDESSELTMPNNTAVIATPIENNENADGSDTDAEMEKFVSVSTQTSGDVTLHVVDLPDQISEPSYVNKLETENIEIEILKTENYESKPEVPAALQEYCANLSKSTLSLVNQCFNYTDSKLIANATANFSLNAFSDNLFCQSFEIAKQDLVAGRKNSNEDFDSGLPVLSQNSVDENNVVKIEAVTKNENERLIQAIGDMVESVIPSVVNINIMKLVKRGLNDSEKSADSPGNTDTLSALKETVIDNESVNDAVENPSSDKTVSIADLSENNVTIGFDEGSANTVNLDDSSDGDAGKARKESDSASLANLNDKVARVDSLDDDMTSYSCANARMRTLDSFDDILTAYDIPKVDHKKRIQIDSITEDIAEVEVIVDEIKNEKNAVGQAVLSAVDQAEVSIMEESFDEHAEEHDTSSSLALSSTNDNDIKAGLDAPENSATGQLNEETDATDTKKRKKKKKKKKKRKSVGDILEDEAVHNHVEKKDDEDVFDIIELPNAGKVVENENEKLEVSTASPSPLLSPPTEDINDLFPGLASPREDKYSLRVDDSFDVLETVTDSHC